MSADHRRRRAAPDNPMHLAESLASLSRDMGLAAPDVLGTVFGRWDQVVGPAMATHVKPLQLSGDTLVVSADHPAWAAQMRQLSAQVLERLREVCGEGSAPAHIEVRVRV